MKFSNKEKKFDLALGLPIWYGAKVSDIEACLDSIYSAFEKFAKDNCKGKIKIIIGIDNIPEDFKETSKKINNIKEILDRINIFNNALNILNKECKKDFYSEYFITEYNVKVSVMRNIMISKSQDSKYICFSDHDDKLFEDSFKNILTDINKYYDKGIVAVYYRCYTNVKTSLNNLYQGLAPWGNIISTEFLLKNNISFIPNIPLEDRFFRRQLEMFAIEEEQINSDYVVYFHNKEQGSGQLDNNSHEKIRQELFKRIYYMKAKIRNFATIKRGINEILYFDTFYGEKALSEITSSKNVDEFLKTVTDLYHDNQRINENEIKKFKFNDKYELFSFIMQNHFALCSITTNGKIIETFCKGFLTDGALENFLTFKNDIEKKDFKKIINIIVELLDLKSIKIPPLLNYIFSNKNKEIQDNILKISKNFLNINNTDNFSGIISKLNENQKMEFKGTTEAILSKIESLRNKDMIKYILDKNIEKLNKLLRYEKFLDFQNITDDKKLSIIDILKKLDSESDIKKILEEYLLNQAIYYVNTENFDDLKNLISLYPDLLNKFDENNINLSNMACRRQTIGNDFEKYDTKKYFTEEKSKIITFLFLKSPESFKIKDKYGKNGIYLLVEEFIYDIKFNFELNELDINNFIVKSHKILEIFDSDKDCTFEMIPLLRFIYKMLLDKKNAKIINDFLKKSESKKEITFDEKKKFFDSINNSYLKYLNENLIKDNILNLLKSKNYNKIKDLIFIRKESLNMKLGSQKNQDIPEIILTKYCHFAKFINLISKDKENKKELLNLMKNDKNIKEIVNEFLMFSLKFMFNINLTKYGFIIEDPIRLINIQINKYIIYILYSEKFNFDKKITFDELLNLYYGGSNTIISLHYLLKYSNSVLENKNKFNSKKINKINKINEEHKNISKDIENAKRLFNNIELIKNKKDTDFNKMIQLLNLFKKFVLYDIKVKENVVEKTNIQVF